MNHTTYAIKFSKAYQFRMRYKFQWLTLFPLLYAERTRIEIGFSHGWLYAVIHISSSEHYTWENYKTGWGIQRCIILELLIYWTPTSPTPPPPGRSHDLWTKWPLDLGWLSFCQDYLFHCLRQNPNFHIFPISRVRKKKKLTHFAILYERMQQHYNINIVKTNFSHCTPPPPGGKVPHTYSWKNNIKFFQTECFISITDVKQTCKLWKC